MPDDLRRLCETAELGALQIQRARGCGLIEAVVRATLATFDDASSDATTAAGIAVGKLLDPPSKLRDESIARAAITAAVNSMLDDPALDRRTATGRAREPRLADRVSVKGGGRLGHVAILTLGLRGLRVSVAWDRGLEGFELDPSVPDTRDAADLAYDGSTGAWIWPGV